LAPPDNEPKWCNDISASLPEGEAKALATYDLGVGAVDLMELLEVFYLRTDWYKSS
jgi:hypothetical protein